MATPLVAGGPVYVLTADRGIEGLDANGVFRVDLATAEVTQLVATPSAPDSFASEGERLFVTRDGGVDAYGLADGAALWSWEQPPAAGRAVTFCAEPAVRAGRVFVGCQVIERVDAGGWTLERAFLFGAALDAATGEARWTWIKDASAELGRGILPLCPRRARPRASRTSSPACRPSGPSSWS